MYYAQHENLKKQILFSSQNVFPGLRLFDAPVGLFYTRLNKPIKVGIKGQADLRGWITIFDVAIAVEVEIKSGKSRIRKGPQRDWQNFCLSFGVIHIQATSPEQFNEELKTRINEIKEKLRNGILNENI